MKMVCTGGWKMQFFFLSCILAAVSSGLAVKLLDLGYRHSRPSSAEIAEIISHLKRARTNSIDMDYFGESVERSFPLQRTSNEIARSKEIINPFTQRPIIVYLNEPKVPNGYQKKTRAKRGSSSEEDISTADVMQFLVQVDARLKEQEGRPLDKDFHENMKLINFLRTFRRLNEETDEETSDSDEKIVKPKKMSKERSYKKREPRIYTSIEKTSYKSKEERGYKSMEDRYNKPREEKSYKPREERVYKSRDSPKQRNRYAQKSDKQFNFMRTPKPMVGRVGIYEK